MKLLSGHITPKRVHAALETLPEKLGGAYDDIMERINRQDDDQKTIAITALTWITYAKERLTVHELLHAVALGLEPDSTDIQNDDLIHVDLLLSSCAGLVILNHEDGIIRLVHYTTQDYLESRFQNTDANAFLAKSCLTYFAFDAFSDSLVILEEGPLRRLFQRYPLSGYAAQYWGYHARQGREADLERTILSTLGTQEKRDLIEYFEDFRRSRFSFGNLWNLSLLHLISMRGLSQTCSTFLNDDVKLSDPT
jgi:hypothetical protein